MISSVAIALLTIGVVSSVNNGVYILSVDTSTINCNLFYSYDQWREVESLNFNYYFSGDLQYLPGNDGFYAFSINHFYGKCVVGDFDKIINLDYDFQMPFVTYRGDDTRSLACDFIFNDFDNYLSILVNVYSGEDVYIEQYFNIDLDYYVDSVSSDYSVQVTFDEMFNDVELYFSKSNNMTYNSGYNTGYSNGFADGIDTGYDNGFINGYNEGFNADTTVASIFSGILSIAMVPVNFFLSIFNFEILGINMSSFVSAFLTVAIVIIVIKMVSGKGKE